MKPTTQSTIIRFHLSKIVIICKSTKNFFDRKQHDCKPWEVKILCDYQKLQSKSTLPQRTQKISSANKAWDGISWSWEQSRQLAPLLRQKKFPSFFFFSHKWFKTHHSQQQTPQHSKTQEQTPHCCMQTGNEICWWWFCLNTWRYSTFLFRVHLKPS